MKTLKRSEYNNIYGVYKIKSLIDNKIYIGSTKNLYGRNLHHFECLVGNYHRNFKLQRFSNKHGINNLEFEIIEIVEKIEDLLIKEQYYIDLYNSCDNGFNIVPIVESTTNGYKHTDETKIKIGEKSKNRIFSVESKIKMANNRIGICCGENNNHLSKLKENEVIIIKKMLNSDLSITDISKFFNVNFRTIGNIKYNIRWKYLIITEKLTNDEIKYYKNIFESNKNIRKNSVLIEKEVKHIKYLIENNTDKKKIKNFFNISSSSLNNIIRGKNWKDIEAEKISDFNIN
jgi:group I intron endonuclease